MRKTILLLLMFVSAISFAQITKNPLINSTSASKAAIDAVVLSPYQTNIVISVTIGYNEWVRISPKTKIEYNDPNSGALITLPILGLQNTNGGSLAQGTKYTYLPHNIFILKFPPLPKNVSKINLIEEGKWKWYGVSFTPRWDVIAKRIANDEAEVNNEKESE